MKTNNIVILLLCLLMISGCHLNQSTDTVIYDTDNRQDLYEVTDIQVWKNSRAIASAWSDWQVTDNRDGTSTLYTSNFGKRYNLCPTERFRRQPIGAHCTAFLVASDIIVTAGHCIKEVEDLVYVFGYDYATRSKNPTVVKNKDIYRVDEVLFREFRRSGNDFAILRLDRPVLNREPLKVTSRPVARGDRLYLIGHPFGLPAKFSGWARAVNDNWERDFSHYLSTFGGNSGSPVFNDRHEVVGVHVRGLRFDMKDVGGCKRLVVYDTTGDRIMGASANKATQWLQYIPED